VQSAPSPRKSQKSATFSPESKLQLLGGTALGEKATNPTNMADLDFCIYIPESIYPLFRWCKKYVRDLEPLSEGDIHS
jgi:hypothetical protein